MRLTIIIMFKKPLAQNQEKTRFIQLYYIILQVKKAISGSLYKIKNIQK